MHGRALAGRDGQLLDAASTRFADITLTLFAAEASTAAVRAHRRTGRRRVPTRHASARSC